MWGAVDTKAQLRAGQLLDAVGNAERERAAAPNEVPLGEWAAFRVRPNPALQSLTAQLQLTDQPSQPAQVSVCHSMPSDLRCQMSNAQLKLCHVTTHHGCCSTPRSGLIQQTLISCFVSLLFLVKSGILTKLTVA